MENPRGICFKDSRVEETTKNSWMSRGLRKEVMMADTLTPAQIIEILTKTELKSLQNPLPTPGEAKE